jgi:hypothetical protein
VSVKPPLVPANGTTFHGSVRVMPNGERLATCYVRQLDGTSQGALIHSFDSEDDARGWVEATGGTRGYTSMTWDA